MTFTTAQFVWLLLLIASIVLEAATVNLVGIWFAIGAGAALITTAFTGSWTVQFIVFGVVSAVAVIATKPLAQKLRHRRPVPTNADLNVGRKARVIAAIQPGAAGRVRLDGVDWQAYSGEALEEGALCEVLDIDGATLLVKPLSAAKAPEPSSPTIEEAAPEETPEPEAPEAEASREPVVV